MRQCHVEVVNVLSEAHAAQDDGDGGVVVVVECPYAQDEEEQAYPLLFHAIDTEPDIAPEARLAMVRCLVQRWGADVRAVVTLQIGLQFCPLFTAALSTAHDVVAFFLGECGVDVNMATPRTMQRVLHAFACQAMTISNREATRMLKYLVEERGVDPTLKNVWGQDAQGAALGHRNNICINYFSSLLVRDSK